MENVRRRRTKRKFANILLIIIISIFLKFSHNRSTNRHILSVPLINNLHFCAVFILERSRQIVTQRPITKIGGSQHHKQLFQLPN